jgi:hypothetical protein
MEPDDSFVFTALGHINSLHARVTACPATSISPNIFGEPYQSWSTWLRSFPRVRCPLLTFAPGKPVTFHPIAAGFLPVSYSAYLQLNCISTRRSLSPQCENTQQEFGTRRYLISVQRPLVLALGSRLVLPVAAGRCQDSAFDCATTGSFRNNSDLQPLANLHAVRQHTDAPTPGVNCVALHS